MDLLILETGLGERDVRAIAATAPIRYKTYEIEKRNGGKRLISQPARELKALQRVIVNEVLDKLPVHPAATAYRPSLSIKDNAKPHTVSGAILKLDFKDFFPSLREVDWESYCKQHNIFETPEDIHLSSRILFHRKKTASTLRLAIGAPSSPTLSNVLMFELDTHISKLVASDGITYTRYADDMTFSAPRAWNLVGTLRKVRKLLRDTASPRLQLNTDKTVLVTKKYRRVVTGLVISDDQRVSLGHERKRLLRAAVYRFIQGKLSIREQARLAGNLAFAYSIEPEFIQRLEDRYGTSTITDIKRAPRLLQSSGDNQNR
ncbi:MAG: RNA-directed DNA polymerase [Methylobacteriaceae bacterium]|nr:RNA-directed DNA polymerase [Methylobacteriaceae bacterium]